MASLNKVLIIGNLGADPEVRYSANGDAIANLRVATTESWKDKNSGEKKEATEWHRVVLYRKLAEIAGQYLKKGSQVYLEGKIQTRKWQNKDGVDQYTTEIVATEMKMLGGRGGNDAGDGDNGGYQRQQGGQQQGGNQRQQGGGHQQGGGNQQNNPNGGKKPGAWDDLGDDIPF